MCACMQKIKFFTLGCKVNQYDTQLLREKILSDNNFQEVENGDPADVYIINTCTVTHSADNKSISFVRRAKKENPSATIIVTGCLTELDELVIQKETPALIVKNKDKNRIVSWLNSSFNSRLDFSLGITYFKGHHRAFLKIQDGCDNFCSFCKIPLVRGKPTSKPLKQIIEEAKALIQNNYKEIVLCGVCLGSFGKDLSIPLELIDVLEELDKLEGEFRLRLSSLEGWQINDNFINRIDKIKRLCPHFHIPLQSGDEKILKLMNRPIHPQKYLEIISALKEKLPLLTVTTDVLIGFPQEAEENFNNTLKLIQKIKPLKIHIFRYSVRAKTYASLLKGRVASYEVSKRLGILKGIAQDISREIKRSFLGKELRVLFEFSFKEKPYIWQGYTDNYLKVNTQSKDDLSNKFCLVKLESLKGDILSGTDAIFVDKI